MINTPDFDVLAHFDSEIEFLEKKMPDFPVYALKHSVRLALQHSLRLVMDDLLPAGSAFRRISAEELVYKAAGWMMSAASGQYFWDLTDDPDQWESTKGYFRHRRCRYVRKHKITGVVEFERGVFWTLPDGSRQFTDASVVRVELPFKPRTFEFMLDEQNRAIISDEEQREFLRYYPFGLTNL